MVNTRNSEGDSVNSDKIASQLAAIAAKLDSLIALKEDIAAIKAAWMDNKESGDEKEPEDEPKDPPTDLVKEVDTGEDQDKNDDQEDQFKDTLEWIRYSDEVVGSETVLGAGQLAKRPSPESKNHKVLEGPTGFDQISTNSQQEPINQSLLVKQGVAIANATDAESKVDSTGFEGGVHRQKYASHKQNPTVQTVEDLRHAYNNKDDIHNMGSRFLHAGNKDVQADLKRRDLAGKLSSSRLEVKSFLRAGSIDTNPGHPQ